MSYVGNQPYQAAFVTDTFSGNGSTTAFTMSVAPAGTSSVLVAVTGVLQDPSTYSVTGTTLTFSAAPPSGTGNISVRYLGIPASGVTTTAYRTVTEFTATAGQTTFTPPSYTVGYINVYRNGVLLGSADYTASNGTTVVLAKGATAGDLVVVESFLVSSVLNAISTSGGTIAGNLTINAPSGQAPLTVQANGTYGLVADASGNVGIGTSSPGVRLQVDSGSAGEVIRVNSTNASGTYLRLQSSGTAFAYVGSTAQVLASGNATDLGFSTPNSMAFATGGFGEKMRIDSSGNLLVGTTTAGLAGITVGTTTTGKSVTAYASSYGNNGLFSSYGTDGGLKFQAGAGSNTLAYIYAHTSCNLDFYSNGTQNMRLDTNGNLLVGATSQINADKVGITFNGQTQNGIVLKTTYASTGSDYFQFYNSAGTIAGRVTQNGTTTVAYTTSSDYRLKEDVQPMTNALDRVAALKPVTYKWKSDGSNGEGFIAHELQSVVPDCVIGEKDAVDAEGSPIYQGIDTSFLVATLTAAIQELNAKIDAQAAEIAALKGAQQ